MPGKYTFATSCVGVPQSRVPALHDMIDRAREITYRTFTKHVDPDELKELFPFYTWGPGRQEGLRLSDDWAVSFHRSKFEGRKCVYIRHSAIEYIFTV
jgi:hypothetical protein